MPASNPPAPPRRMAGHRLCRTHRQLAGVIAEGTLDSNGFQFVAQIRRSAVRIDVVHFLRSHFGIVQRIQHYAISAISVFCWLGRGARLRSFRNRRFQPESWLRDGAANSNSSRIRMPAPSPITNPSRPESHGRLAFSGASLRVESARIAAKPPTPSGSDRSFCPASNHAIVLGGALDACDLSAE